MPGPVVRSRADRRVDRGGPVLLAGDQRCAELASGEAIATVAMPPAATRAPNADVADVVLLARDGTVAEATPAPRTNPSIPAADFSTSHRRAARAADVARAHEYGVLITAAQLVGAGRAMLAMSVDYARTRTQFGRVIGSYQAIKHKLADVHIALELARPLVFGAAVALAEDSPDTVRDVKRRQGRRVRRRAAGGTGRCRPTGRSAIPPNAICPISCCGPRPCIRHGVAPPRIGGECWRPCNGG